MRQPTDEQIASLLASRGLGRSLDGCSIETNIRPEIIHRWLRAGAREHCRRAETPCARLYVGFTAIAGWPSKETHDRTTEPSVAT